MSDLDKIVKFLARVDFCMGIPCRECLFEANGYRLCRLRGSIAEGQIREMVTNAVLGEVTEQTKLDERFRQAAGPGHYSLDPEPVDVIRKWGLNFFLGNAVKYIARAGRKDGESREKDLKKAMDYLHRAIYDRWPWEDAA